MSDALISVIIPIYNMEAYLSRCLDSVLNSTYRSLEIICIDDGSTDKSLEILRDYETIDSRLVVISKENGGVSSARNTGLDRMTGEYVSFVDPDDLVHPQYFELLLQAAQAKGNSISLSGSRTVEDKDFPLKLDPVSFDVSQLRTLTRTQFFQNHEYRSFCWGRLIPANLLKDLHFREILPYSEDSVFMAELGEQNPDLTFVVLDQALYFYYQRDDSLGKTAKVLNRYRVAEIYVSKALAAPGNDRIYLDQAIKRSLSTRYYATHIHLDRELARKCAALLKSCLPALRKTEVYSRKQKAIYSIFIRFPGLYWLYRSVTEPYMWKWEQVERKKRRETKKSDSVSS